MLTGSKLKRLLRNVRIVLRTKNLLHNSLANVKVHQGYTEVLRIGKLLLLIH